jgi:hypothetical protein
MSVYETFIAVFMATLMSQLCVFLIERYFKKKWASLADKAEDHITNVKEKFKRERGGEFI